MGYLEKNLILHRRGEDKKLLPIDYFIKEFNATVSYIPFTRGQFLSFSAKLKSATDENGTKLAWEEFVHEHLLKPKLTLQEVKDLKMVWEKSASGAMKPIDPIDVLVIGLYKVSGVDKEPEDNLKKN